MHPNEKTDTVAECAAIAAREVQHVGEADLYDAFAYALRLAAKFCEQEARRASKRERVRKCSQRLDEAMKDLHANG